MFKRDNKTATQSGTPEVFGTKTRPFLRDVAQWLRRQFWELEICEFESRHPDTLNVARGVIEALKIVTLPVRGQNPSGQIFGLIL